MDRPSQPHVIRTWAVDRIRAQAPAQWKPQRAPKNLKRRANQPPKRRKP